MSQKNIERQELSMTPLEIARNKSAENLKTYGLDFGRNGSGNLNYISAIKHSLRNEDPNVDYFDDYSASFYEALKKFQEKKGLNSTGILDIETLVELDKAYPNTFKDSERAKFLKYFQNKNEYISKESKNISKETKEKIVNSELDLVGDNISKPKNEVLETVRKSLNLTGNLEEMRKQIVNFQKMHCLHETDGIIGKETYYEVVAKDYFTNDKQSEILEKGPSKADQKIILEIFQNGRISSVELNKISIILKNFKEKNSTNANFESEFGDFYKKYDALVTEYRNSPAGKADEQMADKNRESLYGAMKKMVNGEMEITEGIKQIATNPALVLTAGITFLFGMWGSETKMSDAWWKRILLLIAAPVAVPAAWKLAGGNEILDDIGNGVKDVKNGLNSAEAQAQKNEIASETHNFIVRNGTDGADWIKTRANEIHNGIKTGDTSKLPAIFGGAIADKNISKEQIETQIYENTKTVLSNMYNKNLSYKNSTNESEKSKYIEKEDFETISTAIQQDEVFGSKFISELENVKTDADKIKTLLSDSSKNLIFPENLTGEKLEKRKKDLVTYVGLLLTEKEGKDGIVSDIFIKDKGILERAKDSLIDNNITEYIRGDEKLNSEVNNIVNNLTENSRSGVKSILSSWNFASDNHTQKINELITYKNNSKIGPDDKVKIELLENIYKMEYGYRIFEKNVDVIDVNGGKESLSKLETERKNFNEKYYEAIILNKEIVDKAGVKVNIIFADKVSKKVEETKLKIIENKKELRESIEYKNIYELEKTYKEFIEKYSKIPAIPKGEKLEDYKTYITQENMLLYDDVLTIYKKYHNQLQITIADKRPKYIELENAEKPNEIIKLKDGIVLDSDDQKKVDILLKGQEVKGRLNKILERINDFVELETKKIDDLTEKIKIAKDRGENNFNARVGEFDSEMRSIFDTFYPNNKPSEKLDMQGLVNYLSEKNRTSVVYGLVSNLNIAFPDYKNGDLREDDENIKNLKQKVSSLNSSIINLKATLEGTKKEVKDTIIGERKSHNIYEKGVLKENYQNFYDKYISELNRIGVPEKSSLRLIPSKEENNITFNALGGFLENLNSKIETYNKNITDKDKKINIDNFNSEFVKISNIVVNYVNTGNFQN